ncbi:MAG: hypothetical protein H0U86_16515, partial [Chloroflexi bacterium]|nr:hypothetical protein [Chloroflexota bacterium]
MTGGTNRLARAGAIVRRWYQPAALGLFALLALDTLPAGAPEWWIGTGALLLSALVLRRMPWAFGAAVIVAGIVLRVPYLEPRDADQIIVAQQAGWAAFAGQNPYVGVYGPFGQGFVYGPLALGWWLVGGPWVEVVASVAMLVLLAGQRAWLTLGVMAAWEPVAALPLSGVNDYSPALLIAGAMILLRSHAVWGAALLAVAAALKPYAAAWFLPAIGYGGWHATLTLVGLSAVLWSPLLAWGPGNLLRNVEVGRAAHPEPNSLNIPEWRWLGAIPAVAGLLARQWDVMCLAGCAAFVLVLFLDRWASTAYWFAAVPIIGLALEWR